AIACFVLIFRVMSLVALPNAYILFVHGVHFVADHLDHHGLVHLVALDATDEPPARNPLATAGVFRGFSAHALPPSFWLGCCSAAKALSCRMSSMRATSFLVLPSRLVSSSWPV